MNWRFHFRRSSKLQNNTNNNIREALRTVILSLIPKPKSSRKRIDNRRFAPLFVIGLFVLVTISHEAFYAGSFEHEGFKVIGWPYAVGMNMSILIAEYFTRWSTTRKWAWAAFYVVSIGSGMMNVAYVRPWTVIGIDGFFAWIYAILPTVIIIFLGFLSSSVGKLASSQEARWERLQGKYMCFCGEKFSSSISLKKHIASHVIEIYNDVESSQRNAPAILKVLREMYPDKENLPTISNINKIIRDIK